MARKFEKTTQKSSKARPGKGPGKGKGAASRKSSSGRSTPGQVGGIRLAFRGIRALFSRGKKASRAPASPRPISTGLSLDRKLDILGIALALVGLLTLLALPSSSHGSLTGGWMTLIGQAFGWGMYLFPLSCLGIGLWLVLRNFERIPQISVERLAGLLLMYASLLVILHFIFLPPSRTEAFDLAAVGKGGGYIGALLLDFLRANLGWGGAAVALAASWLIALGLALDVSIVDLFRWRLPKKGQVLPGRSVILSPVSRSSLRRRSFLQTPTSRLPMYCPGPKRCWIRAAK
jgi:hypothetical protein